MIVLMTSKFFFRAVLTINSLLVLLPVFFLLNSALRETNSFASNPFVLARDPYWQNFEQVWLDGAFAIYLKNSLIVTGGSLFVILICALGAGFILGRYNFRGNALIFGFVLTGMLVPAKLAILPLFIQLKWMNLLDSHFGLILVYSSGALPAAVFIMSGFFRSLPSDLDNAARIDGASEFQLLRRILIPLVRPGMAIVAIYSAIPIWNDFFLPLVFLQSPENKTIMQGLTVFFGQYASQWGVLFAGLTMAALPLIVLYLILSEQFIKGLTAGAVKG
ncbi:sugar ABC transporter permease [Actinomycetes bacterium]|nr:sugar ABC transporter permease [Actinomycetes bacterium]